MNQKKLAVLAVLVLTLCFASVAKAGSSYAVGDVFLGVTGVGVVEYTSSGAYVQTINGGALGTYTTGMSFQSNGNLLVTNFSGGTVAQYDNAGNLLNATFASGMSNPESIAIDSSGNIYVGQAGAAQINEYSSTGTFLGSTTATTQGRGTDWIDLAANQTTMLYTSEGSKVMSVTVPGGAQNADFSNVGGVQYALRIIPTGTYAGDVLVANSSNALLISSTGTVLQTYTLPGNGGGDFALNIDPNGTDFWTADYATNTVWEVNIATGAIDAQWTSNGNCGVGAYCGAIYGLVVYGQQTASGGGGGVVTGAPEPGTLTLLAGGLLSLGGLFKKFRRA